MADEALSAGRGVKVALDEAMAERPGASGGDAAQNQTELGLELAEAEAGAPAGYALLGELTLEDGLVRGDARRRGRPRGSQNKTTTDMLRLLRAKGYQDPLEAAAQIYSRPTAVLAAEMGIKRSEAANLQMRAIDASLPYWHSKKPIGIDLGEGALPIVQIVNLAQGGPLDTAQGVEIGRIVDHDPGDQESEENQ